MILTCPACSARYLLATDAIGEQGRTVRCGKCQHIWHEEAVRDSLDDLNAVDFAEGTDVAPDNVAEDIPQGVKPIEEFPAYKPAAEPSRPALVLALQKRLPLITGIAMAVAVFALIAAGIISARTSIITHFPSTQPIFVALGVEQGASEKTLVFDSVTAKIEKESLIVTGSLINLSSAVITLPPLAVELLDGAGQLITAYPAELDKKTLSGEQSLDLNFSYKDIPAEAQQARLKFVSVEAEPTTAAEGADNTPAHSAGDSGHPTAHE